MASVRAQHETEAMLGQDRPEMAHASVGKGDGGPGDIVTVGEDVAPAGRSTAGQGGQGGQRRVFKRRVF